VAVIAECRDRTLTASAQLDVRLAARSHIVWKEIPVIDASERPQRRASHAP
jgi:hypothetical protein